MRMILLVVLCVIRISGLCQTDETRFDYATGRDTLSYDRARDTSWVRYTTGFDFREGFYLKASELLRNRPSIPLDSVVDKHQRPLREVMNDNASDWYGKLIERKNGKKVRTIHARDIWGFCDKNQIYVQVPISFAIGFGWFELDHPQTLSSLVRYGFSNNGRGAAEWSVGPHFLLDMKTGNIYEPHMDNVPAMIADDLDLLMIYEELPKSERKSMARIMNVIQLYNQRHPLYFPK